MLKKVRPKLALFQILAWRTSISESDVSYLCTAKDSTTFILRGGDGNYRKILLLWTLYYTLGSCFSWLLDKMSWSIIIIGEFSLFRYQVFFYGTHDREFLAESDLVPNTADLCESNRKEVEIFFLNELKLIKGLLLA